MVKFTLEICGRLENIKELYVEPDPSTRWYVKLECSNCQGIQGSSKFVYFDGELHPTSTKGDANYVAKCRECKRELTIVIVPNSLTPYLNLDEVEPTYEPIIQLDCRGVIPIEYEFRGGWNAKAMNSNTVFNNLEFTDANSSEVDWCDFDEKAEETVGVYGLKSRFAN